MFFLTFFSSFRYLSKNQLTLVQFTTQQIFLSFENINVAKDDLNDVLSALLKLKSDYRRVADSIEDNDVLDVKSFEEEIDFKVFILLSICPLLCMYKYFLSFPQIKSNFSKFINYSMECIE